MKANGAFPCENQIAKTKGAKRSGVGSAVVDKFQRCVSQGEPLAATSAALGLRRGDGGWRQKAGHADPTESKRAKTRDSSRGDLPPLVRRRRREPQIWPASPGGAGEGGRGGPRTPQTSSWLIPGPGAVGLVGGGGRACSARGMPARGGGGDAGSARQQTERLQLRKPPKPEL